MENSLKKPSVKFLKSNDFGSPIIGPYTQYYKNKVDKQVFKDDLSSEIVQTDNAMPIKSSAYHFNLESENLLYGTNSGTYYETLEHQIPSLLK